MDVNNITFLLGDSSINLSCNPKIKLKEICQYYCTYIQTDINSLIFLYKRKPIDMELTFEETANSVDKNKKKMKILVNKKDNSGLICPKSGTKIKPNQDEINDKMIYIGETLEGAILMINNLINISSSNKINLQLKNIIMILSNLSEYINKFTEQLGDKEIHNKSSENFGNNNIKRKRNNQLNINSSNNLNIFTNFKTINNDDDSKSNEDNNKLNNSTVQKTNYANITKHSTQMKKKHTSYLNNNISKRGVNEDEIRNPFNNSTILKNNFIIDNNNDFYNTHNNNDNFVNNNNLLISYNKKKEGNNKKKAIKNEIKGILIINSDNIDKEITFFKTFDAEEIEVYLEQEKIEPEFLEEKWNFNYNFDEDGKYIFNIVFKKPPTKLSSFFEYCLYICCLDFSNFKSSEVADMSSMFDNCINLEEIIGLDRLITKNVTSMRRMFCGCFKLKSLNLSQFDTSNVSNMSSMFFGCKSITEIKGLNYFKTSKVITMKQMFHQCEEIIDLDLTNFNTSNVEIMDGMFYDCKKLKIIKGLEKIKTNKVITIRGMFMGCESLKSLNLSNFDTSNVIKMTSMFKGCTNLKEIKGIDYFETSEVTNMHQMFSGCESITNLDLTDFDTPNVMDMSGMFSGCKNLKVINGLDEFITDNVCCMNEMFKDCENLKNLDLSYFDTSKVSNMSSMFCGCFKLEKIEGIEEFITTNVERMDKMFMNCLELKSLNLSNFDTTKVTDMSYMFSHCHNLKFLNLKNFSTYCETKNMFYKTVRITDKNNFIANKELTEIYNNSIKY